jgi:hypothetical protein
MTSVVKNWLGPSRVCPKTGQNELTNGLSAAKISMWKTLPASRVVLDPELFGIEGRHHWLG